MRAYQQQIESVLRVLSLTSATEFSWYGQRVGTLPSETRAAITPEDARTYLLHNLQRHLYGEFYCPGGPQLSAEIHPFGPAIGLSPFIQALSSANAGSGSREPGWTITKRDSAKLVVTRGGLSLWVDPDDVAPSGTAGLEAGAAVSVRLPKELLRLSPGFYMALGDSPLPADAAAKIVRLYWNLDSAGAPRFVARSTTLLNQARLPFRMKVVSEPERYTRCDAGVIYVVKRDYRRTRAVLVRLYREISAQLKPRTPAFTKELAPGLGLAEDPGNGESFGMHRCSLLAEGIVRGAEGGAETLADQLRAVAERFREAGISLDRPYLAARSTAKYEPLRV